MVIESPKGDETPDRIVAIINPMTENPNTERSLASLTAVTHDAKTATTSGNFLMSNSTYAKDGIKQMAVSVTDKIKKTSGEALNDPVDIYVERAVAKVRLNSSLTPVEGTENIFKTSDDGSQKVELDEVTGEQEIYVSAQEQFQIWELKEKIARLGQASAEQKVLVRDLLKPGDVVVLVIPIDTAAPKGRLILPQQQVIRDVLEAGASALCVRNTELTETLQALKEPPALVITDSQVFKEVDAKVPEHILLTSFSI